MTLQTTTPPASKAKYKEYAYTTTAVVLFLVSIGILILLACLTLPGGFKLAAPSIPLIALIAAAVLSAVGGFLFLDASNPSAPDAFLPFDRKFLSASITAGNEQAITQYLRLRNMRGVSGFFQKLGLPGLPIATIFVTLVFTVLAVTASNADTSKALFDLAKLTLGAFIGSFVQRSIDPSVNGTATARHRTTHIPPTAPQTGAPHNGDTDET